MSIIYDALKKIERHQAGINSSVSINKADKPKPKIYLVYLLVVSLGFFIASVVFNSFTKPFSIATVKKTQEAIKVTPALLETNIPVLKTDLVSPPEPKKVPPDSFVLNGVFFSQDQGYALINNQIVKEGDRVDGARVLRITLEEVELESGGSTLKFYANR